ncbi:heme transporter CcmA [Avibacterium paragallinarum]|uniref:heme transporter CcmA n=1 Tax=Avibacterium paragallinarum TaxID=728 RepID=UPI003979283A
MIGNNPNATPNRAKTSILEAHSEANQNINNLKFVYKVKDNGEKNEKWLNTEDILKNTYPEGVRKFNEVNKDK